MNVSDELLMAYVDGELDAAQRAAVEHAIAADPQLAGRVRHHQALRRQVRGAFDPVLSEPVPDRLLAVLRKQPPSSAGDKVVAFRRRAPQPAMAEQRARWSWPQWSAMAASWVAGIVMAVVAINLTRDELTTAHNGSLIARGALATALTSQPSGAAVASIRMQLSFKNRSGEYCRSFVIQQQQALVGLACRQANDDWRVPMLAAANGEHGTYRQAGSELPAAVAQWIDTEREGEVLDANAEQAALRAGWRSASQ